MSSIILARNGVIDVILCSSHQARTSSRPSNKYPRSFRTAMVTSLRRSRSVQPLQKCRKRIRRCQNRGVTRPPGSARGTPEACPSGIRHVGGAKLNLALVRNVRTYTAMLREKAQAAPTARPKVPMRRLGADCSVLAEKRGNARGAKGAGHRRRAWVNRVNREEPKSSAEGGSLRAMARAG